MIVRAFAEGYRNQAFATLLGVMATVFGLGAIVYAVRDPGVALPMGIVIVLALFVVFRLARAGAFVTGDGITVVNPLRTVRIPRDRVAGFALRRSGGFPAVGFVELVDGSAVQVWGIQARSGAPAARHAPERAIAALQEHFETGRDPRRPASS